MKLFLRKKITNQREAADTFPIFSLERRNTRKDKSGPACSKHCTTQLSDKKERYITVPWVLIRRGTRVVHKYHRGHNTLPSVYITKEAVRPPIRETDKKVPPYQLHVYKPFYCFMLELSKARRQCSLQQQARATVPKTTPKKRRKQQLKPFPAGCDLPTPRTFPIGGHNLLKPLYIRRWRRNTDATAAAAAAFTWARNEKNASTVAPPKPMAPCDHAMQKSTTAPRVTLKLKQKTWQTKRLHHRKKSNAEITYRRTNHPSVG